MIAFAVALQLSLWPPMSGPNAPPLPTTVPLNDPTGKQIGTITVSGGKMYMRNMQGKFIATIVIEDGYRTVYDENGKVLDKQPKPE